MTFQKVRQNLHYMGADKSPFVPQNAVEYAALKLKIAEEKTVLLSTKADSLASRLASKSGTSDVQQKENIKVNLLGGKRFQDDRTIIFAQNCCFNAEHYGQGGQADLASWPSLVRLKEEGDSRARGAQRRLPLPRFKTNAVEHAFEDDETDKFSPQSARINRSLYDMIPCDSAVSEEEVDDLVAASEALPEYLSFIIGKLDLVDSH